MLRAAVLAGGLSSRMGHDKALLSWQGQSWLDRALTLLRGTGADVVCVSGRPDHPLGVPDLLPHQGPPGAVLSLLHWLQQRNQLDGAPLLLVPVDMPLLTLPTLQQLLCAVVPGRGARFGQEMFPCVLPASAALHSHLQVLFAQPDARRGGERSLRALLAFTQAVAVDTAGVAPAEFRNVNTPEELQQLLASTSR